MREEQKQAGAAAPMVASSSFEELAAVLENMSDAFFALDQNWCLTRINAQYEKIGGVKREDRLGKSFLDILNERGVRGTRYWDEFHKVMNERVSTRFEAFYPQMNMWTECRAYPTENGGMVVFFSDISERKNALDQLAQIFSGSPAFMAFLSLPDFRFEKANRRYLELINKDDIIGKTLDEVLPESREQGFREILEETARSGKPYIGKAVPFTLKNGLDGKQEKKYIDFVYQPLRHTNSEVYGIAVQGYEVSEAIKAQELINKSRRQIALERENFRNLFKQTPEMVCILEGPEHRFEFVNESHVKVLGFNATGMTVKEAQPESVEIHDILDQVYKTGQTAELKEIPVTVGGRLRYFNLTYAARFDEEGNTNGVMILGTEITDQVRARTSLERVARLIDAMPSPFFATNAQWEVVYWNPACVEITGRSKEKVIGRSLWEVFPGVEETELGEIYKRARAEQKVFSTETYYPRYEKWYRVWPFPFEDGVAATFLDMTEQKKIEEELERSKERYQLLFNYSPLPKIIFDVETLKIIDVNETAIKHYGYSREEFMNMTKAALRPPEDVDQLKEWLTHKHMQTEVEVQTGLRHVKKDGTIINVEISALDLWLNGRRARLCAIVDVTDKIKVEQELKHLVENLQEAKSEAEKANRLKSAFLANMSHEIRTPLGAIIGFADLLREPDLAREEHDNYLNIITRNGEQLAALINDILDLSKVEAGHLTLEYTSVRPADIAQDVISLLQVKAGQKGLALEFIHDPSMPQQVTTDGLRLRQVLMNIVGNAIKFTPSGAVKIKAYGREENGKHLLFYEVADTGIGIPASQQERIFDAFVQADGTLSRKFGGTGLGLALSRELARHLGGDVRIEKSLEGKGTTFTISIQDRTVREVTLAPSPERSEISETVTRASVTSGVLSGVEVLVVDDSPDNRQLILRCLSKQGAAVAFAENGAIGYEKALAGDFDVVLMDLQMPEMDGYTATEKLRHSGYRGPIIALTAHAMNEVRQKCIDAGCTDHLTKPIRMKELVDTVARYASM